MNIEQQVPSLDLCKQLKELGWNHPTLFYWEEYLVGENEYMDFRVVMYGEWECDEDEHYPAPTVAELGEALPHYIGKHNGYPYEMWNNKHNGKWNVGYQTVKGYPLMGINADTEANARAKMWIYLKENNII